MMKKKCKIIRRFKWYKKSFWQCFFTFHINQYFLFFYTGMEQI